MISTYMIFTVLAATALAKGLTECNFTGPTGVRQCFGAVGHLLIFHLPNTAYPDIRLTKDEKHLILKVGNHNVTVERSYVNQPESFTNGTFKLGNAMKKHSGVYVLEEFNSGVLVKKISVCLELQAPVSKPVVSQMCLSPEQKNISCSSEGDGVEFKLTLNGFSLMQTRGHSQPLCSWTTNMQSLARNKSEDTPSASNVTINLDGQLNGNLMCCVWNNVSRDETVIQMTSCKDSSSFPVVTVAVIATVVNLLLLAVLCFGIIHLRTKPRPTTVRPNEGNYDDEIVYADVKVIRNTRNSHQNAT